MEIISTQQHLTWPAFASETSTIQITMELLKWQTTWKESIFQIQAQDSANFLALVIQGKCAAGYWGRIFPLSLLTFIKVFYRNLCENFRCCIISHAGCFTDSFKIIFLVRMRRLAGRIENQQKLTYNSYTKYGAVFDNGQQLNTDLVDRRRNLYQSNKMHITFSDVLGSSWDEIAQTKVRLNGYLSFDQKLSQNTKFVAYFCFCIIFCRADSLLLRITGITLPML